MKTLTDEQKTILHAIDGTANSHYELARYCELKGLTVEGDSDDMELSYLLIEPPPATEYFWDYVVGEIRGDDEAVIKITAEIE